MCSLYRGFLISRFVSIFFTIANAKNIVRYTEEFDIERFVKGDSLVLHRPSLLHRILRVIRARKV